ncbi:Golgi SNAP receptor complex member 1 [Galdieria sulphuraria]|nr:Golgi SNAP receptor complex member 1 [Galdieria sulphuraria]
MSSSTLENGWEALGKEARRLESEIDSKLVSYASLSSRTEVGFKNKVGGNKSVAADEQKLSTEIEQLLRRLGQLNESMGRYLASSSNTSLSQSHALERHQEILSDYIQEFRKSKATVRNWLEKMDLLENSHRNSVSQSPHLSSQEEFLLKERNSVSNSERGADLAINQGLAVREDLARQRQIFASMVSRMEHVSERLPRLNRLIGQIRRRKRRDLIVLCSVVALFMLFTLLWRVF